MNFKILFFGFVVTLHQVHCQECRVVSICNDEEEISNSPRNLNTGHTGRRGEKGDRGVPGKAGPFGLQGLPGEKGIQGVKGESGSTDGIEAFQQEIRNLMADFNHSLSMIESKLNAVKGEIDNITPPVSCLQSNKDGTQLLRSGETAYCHQHWRVIQRRFNGQVIFHNKTWNEYKNGFGSLFQEFWIGLDNVHLLTGNGGCRLRIELGAFDDSEAYAEYREFSIGSGSESDLFRLHISGYSGTAGDSIMHGGYDNNNMAFTTVDRDNDRYSSANCAAAGRGAWWHNNCGVARLNGRWGKNINTSNSFTWYDWKHTWITLRSSMMMIRCD